MGLLLLMVVVGAATSSLSLQAPSGKSCLDRFSLTGAQTLHGFLVADRDWSGNLDIKEFENVLRNWKMIPRENVRNKKDPRHFLPDDLDKVAHYKEDRDRGNVLVWRIRGDLVQTLAQESFTRHDHNGNGTLEPFEYRDATRQIFVDEYPPNAYCPWNELTPPEGQSRTDYRLKHAWWEIRKWFTERALIGTCPFREMDINRNGTLTPETEVALFMRRYDGDRNGTLSQAEFISYAESVSIVLPYSVEVATQKQEMHFEDYAGPFFKDIFVSRPLGFSFSSWEREWVWRVRRGDLDSAGNRPKYRSFKDARFNQDHRISVSMEGDFEELDRNGDGQLDVTEFRPYSHCEGDLPPEAHSSIEDARLIIADLKRALRKWARRITE